MAEQRARGDAKEAIRNWLMLLLFLILLALFTIEAANICISRKYYAVEVVGDSMQDTLFTGDVVYAARDLSTLSRGDIVIIDVSDNPEFSNGNIIKRLIATEGDAVRLQDGKVYLRRAGETEYTLLEEPYAKGVTYPFRSGEAVRSEFELQKGEIFVLGDNREVSHDSRALATGHTLKEENIVGVVSDWSLQEENMVGWWEGLRTLFSRR